MARLQLQLYVDPGQADVFVSLVRSNQTRTYRTVGTIDTGAEVCLMPLALLDQIEHRIINNKLEIEQAGIAGQGFSAIEAEVRLSLEDLNGNETRELKVRAWFAKTDVVLLGFRDLLEHAKLYIDMPHRDGWIEID
jgi:hypothetical protein